MTTNKNTHSIPVTCYSDGEGALMDWSQKLRGKLLLPLLKPLGKWGVRAGHITFLSLLCGLAFCPLFLVQNYIAAFTFLFLHVLLDGIDGPLARYLGRAGDKGSFTDTVADQTVVAATTITMIYSGLVGAWSGGSYLFLYTLVVAFAMIRNAITNPYSWVFRPRFIVFAWFAIEIFWLPGTINYVLWASGLLLALKSITGFIAIRRGI